jgi:hypothetical protein
VALLIFLITSSDPEIEPSAMHHGQPIIDRRDTFAVQDDRSVTRKFIVHGKSLLQFPNQVIRILFRKNARVRSYCPEGVDGPATMIPAG